MSSWIRRTATVIAAPVILVQALALPPAYGASQAGAAAATAAPVPGSQATASTLSAEQLARLEKVVLEQGSDIVLPAPIVSVLKFRPAEVAPKVRQATYQQEPQVKHGFALLNDGSGYLLFRRTTASGLTVLRTDRQQRLLGAAHDFAGNRFIELSQDDGQRELDAELSGWSKVLSPAGASLPLPAPHRAAAGDASKPAATPAASPPPAAR